MGWVKSHIGIEGNEAADKEAKRASEGKGLLERTGRMITSYGRRSKTRGFKLGVIPTTPQREDMY